MDLYCFVLILFSSFDKIQDEGSLVPWAPLPSDISQDDYGAVLRVEPDNNSSLACFCFGWVCVSTVILPRTCRYPQSPLKKQIITFKD